MPFKCPICGGLAVSWDARAGLYLCYTVGCRTWFPPPRGRWTTTDALIQKWLDTNVETTSVANHGG